MAAVVMLSLAKADLREKGVRRTLFSMQTLTGLGCGACLGLASVFFKAAILEVQGDDWLLSALYTAGIAVLVQTLAMGAWMAARAPGELLKCLVHWRGSVGAGVFGAMATAGWFTAFSLSPVAPVRAVGQVELLITMGVSVFLFRERVSRMEAASILLLAASIVMVIMG